MGPRVAEAAGVDAMSEIKRLPTGPDGQIPTAEEWRYAVDGIEGHDIPPGWVDDGISPYPWVRHDPDATGAMDAAEATYMAGTHPLAAPLPASVWLRFHREQAARGHAPAVAGDAVEQRAVIEAYGMTGARAVAGWRAFVAEHPRDPLGEQRLAEAESALAEGDTLPLDWGVER